MSITAIDDLPYGLPQAGRIRIGEQYKSRTGKMAARTLKHFRFTSSDRILIDWCAQQYGGTATTFDSPASPDKWKVDSERDTIDAIVSIPGSYDLNYEKRDRKTGALERKDCNGRTCEVMTFTPDDAGWRTVDCICRAKGLNDKTRECDKQLRVPVKLPDCPTNGIWRWDSTSDIAISETRGTFDDIFRAAGIGLHHCKMRLEERRSRGFDMQGKPLTKIFSIVVFDTGRSIESLVAGESKLVQLPAPSPTGALGVGPPTVTPSQAGEPAGNDGAGEGRLSPAEPSPAPSTIEGSVPDLAEAEYIASLGADDDIVDAEVVDDEIEKWKAGLTAKEKGSALLAARRLAPGLGEPMPTTFDTIGDVLIERLMEAGNDEHTRTTTDG